MSQFIQISDFETGRNAVPTNPGTAPDFQAYIDRVEKRTIIKLLGVEMGEALIADPGLYPELLEPFNERINGCLEMSEGLTEMLKALIFFEWARDQYAQLTVGGVERTRSENSDNRNTGAFDLVTRYNAGVTTYQAIQEKAINGNYPDFDGETLEYIIPV